MANTSTFFKALPEDSRVFTTTYIHEHVPITGALISASYTKVPGHDSLNGRSDNIKTYNHGLFQSVYDFPHTSSTANHLFDISYGIIPTIPKLRTPLTANETGFQGHYSGAFDLYNLAASASSVINTNKKTRVYNQFAMQLNGYDRNKISGSLGIIKAFDEDGNSSTDGDAILDAYFLTFSRLLIKDEIKKGSFSLLLGTSKSATEDSQFGNIAEIHDREALTNYKVNSPAGEYALLFAQNTDGNTVRGVSSSLGFGEANATPVGLIYYQAGVVVLDGSRLFTGADGPANINVGIPGGTPSTARGIMTTANIAGDNLDNGFKWASPSVRSGTAGTGMASGGDWDEQMISGTIDSVADNLRNRIQKVSFNNTTKINSETYFCKARYNEFNYSANSTYLSGSEIRVKDKNSLELPSAYVTTVGLYSADNELLAVAKLSEPLKKTPANELTLKVRLDY